MSSIINRFDRESYSMVKERFSGSETYLSNFFFRQGGNVYVLSYQKSGVTRHTFIDAGDSRYRNEIFGILSDSNIDPANIERIIITHRHPDHCGLVDLLADKSRAKILVHANFRTLIEGTGSHDERRWMGDFDPSRLKDYDIGYLTESNRNKPISINNVGFPSLVEPITIGNSDRLYILASPECVPTHSPDQIIVLYSNISWPHIYEDRFGDFRPTDDILFSGDLWLMRGPIFDRSMSSFSRNFRYGVMQLRSLISGRNMVRRDPREQDAEAKEALKKGFTLIRVKPGHGNEFLGSRMIPNSLMASRDLLLEFGYPLSADISVLRSKEMAPRVESRMEQAYTSFIEELRLWAKLGYSQDEITALLTRIYREQTGGGPLVEKDRKERRKRLKSLLTRIKDDNKVAGELHQLAESTLSALKRVA